MAENGENAMKFVNELLDKIKAPFFREMETLRSLKARLTGQENARLNPWDVAYYANLREGSSGAAVPLRHPGRRIRRSRGSMASRRALFHD